MSPITVGLCRWLRDWLSLLLSRRSDWSTVLCHLVRCRQGDCILSKQKVWICLAEKLLRTEFPQTCCIKKFVGFVYRTYSVAVIQKAHVQMYMVGHKQRSVCFHV